MAGRAAPGRSFAAGDAGRRRPRCLKHTRGAAARAMARSAPRSLNASQTGVTTGAHLAAINLGLKAIRVDRRWHRSREVRLLAISYVMIAAAEIGLKELDRLALARTLMERKLEARRTPSKLPELVELAMAEPMVSTAMVANTLEVTSRAGRWIVLELGLREMTGRGRFRAGWGFDHA